MKRDLHTAIQPHDSARICILTYEVTNKCAVLRGNCKNDLPAGLTNLANLASMDNPRQPQHNDALLHEHPVMADIIEEEI